ncbi:PAS domain-containing protein [Sphingomonas sp. 2R-10]|uniref:sensor histidine kinase n=1 Tax=Sphingomonas sp. 2R-10 TaxID=3045148 RepID=UPI000F7B1746|nr:PAS domain-containing protein [Sphingomonas sp. 2R-10]MDJ0275277.1 PAS domain-containing protein [Sphingomonas sp. 2R-10]
MTETVAIDATDPIWHDIAETLPILACIVGDDGQLLWANRCWRIDIGVETPDNLWTFCPDVDRDDVRADWRTGVATGRPFTLALPLPAGTTGFAVRPAGAGRWIAIGSDAETQRRAETAREATQAELDTLTNAMPQMVWATRPDGHHDFYNAQWYRFTGMPEGSTDGEGWNGMFHPDDQERARGRWRQSLTTGEDYEIEYRLRHRSGQYRWVLGRALPVRDADGAIVRWIGTCTDIDSAKRAAEQNDILSRELSHRIKNIFAIVSGLVRMSARQMPAVRGFADDLARRIAALGAAHDLARPHSDISRPVIGDATLHHILRELLSPYATDQWRIEGDDVPIDDRGATPVALIFHELATNAAKYGALSTPEGQVSVRTVRHDGMLGIDWREVGGPAIPGAPQATGFGTRLAALSIEQQLAGRIERDWRPEGLAVRIEVACDALVRDAPT